MKQLKQIFCIGIFMLVFFSQFTQANPFNRKDSITVSPFEKSGTYPSANKITYQKKGPLKSFWHWLTAPFRPVWGRYEEDNNKIDAPYTTFLNAYESSLSEFHA